MPAILRLEDEDEARSGRIQALRPQFMQAMIDFNASQGKPVYPDANSSLRITFGTVRGYSPRDAVQMEPFTTLAGIVEKDTGVEPFDAPKAEIERKRVVEGTSVSVRVYLGGRRFIKKKN